MECSWELLARLWRLMQLIMDDAEPGLDALGLHPKSFVLLAAVEDCPFPAELARVMCLPPPTVTYIVKQLEQKGYVLRKAEPGDLRRFRLVLTTEGREVVLRGQSTLNQVFAARLGRLKAEEVDLFDHFVAKLSQEEDYRPRALGDKKSAEN